MGELVKPAERTVRIEHLDYRSLLTPQNPGPQGGRLTHYLLSVVESPALLYRGFGGKGGPPLRAEAFGVVSY